MSIRSALVVVSCLCLGGCGRPAPNAPTAAGLSLSCSVPAANGPLRGLQSPVDVMVTVRDGKGSAVTIVGGWLTLRDAEESTLTQRSLPPGTGTVSATLSWAAAAIGRRLDVTANVRGTSAGTVETMQAFCSF
jgi:hypothetical protein